MSNLSDLQKRNQNPTKQDILDVILNIQKKFERSPKAWTQKVMARNEYNYPIASVDRNAVCWCWSGAVASVCQDNIGEMTISKMVKAEFMKEVIEEFPNARTLVDCNDHTTYENVMKFISKTVARIKSELLYI